MQINRQKMKNSFLILSWALYDLANQFFALNVVSLYFVRWITLERHAPEIFYSIAFGISTLFVAALGPILGAVSDRTGRRQPFLICMTLLSVVFTMVLGVSENIFLGLLFFAIANFGCQAAVVFYNAQMVNISSPGKIGLISGFGKMMSYLGAVLALYFVKPVVLKSGYRATFLPTGILFLIFALPCMLFIKDNPPLTKINLGSFLKKEKIWGILKGLKETLSDKYKFSCLPDFLRCIFFGLCAVNAIILFMSVYATRAFGLNEAEVINLIAFATLFALVGSMLIGFISDYVGHKESLFFVFILWGVCFVAGAFVRGHQFYWLIGALAGVALGSTWVVSRSLAIALVPPDKIGEIFGLFNLVGYLAAVVGALWWGVLILFLSHLGEWGYRITLLSLTLFVLLGAIFLLRVPCVLPKNKNIL